MRTSRNQILHLLFLAIVVFNTVILSLQSCKEKNPKSETPATDHLNDNAYIGPDACQSCHIKEYAEWKQSDHFKAMMEAKDSTVYGDFNDKVFKADGVTSKFFKRDGKYFINTEGDDGKNHDYEVKYTFGYFPLQQYLVEFPGGRMQVPRVSYDVVKRKWFHQYSGQKIYHRDWLHWTHQSQNWNSMCASCHSTDLKRNYDESSDSYNTTYSHINVSCESCHGMGKSHIEYINKKEYQQGNKVKGSYLLLYKGQKNTEQLSGCVRCHARRMEISAGEIPSTEALDNFIPMVPDTENYFSDGQIREEDYEYGSFTQSKMYHRGVMCSNCHNPHTGKTVYNGNKLCMQCHKPEYDSPQHYFHAENSEGSKCINCHMPTHIYMGVDIRRDHSFRIPRPDQSVKYGTPNACTNCHTGKKGQWAEDVIVKWYGPERKYHYSDDLIPGSRLDENSFAHLNNLLVDTSVTDMIRATALSYLGEIQSEESVNAIKKYLGDTSAMVRNQAVTSLSNFPVDSWINDVKPMLKDPVRAVRISAANTMSNVPKNVIEKGDPAAFSSSKNELMNFLHNQSDFSTGSIMLGDYYFKTGENEMAEKYYLHSLKIDSIANYARLNLSAAYNSEGKNKEALLTLKEAAAIDPANDRVFYNLGLLNYEMNDIPSATENFRKAVLLGSTIPGLFYNYGLALQQQGKLKEAEQILLKGYSLSPAAANINYALAYLYTLQKHPEKAKKHADVLKGIDPQNPDYQVLFRNLGL